MQGENKSSFLQLCNTALIICCLQVLSEKRLHDYSAELLPTNASTSSFLHHLDSCGNICGCYTIVSRTNEIFTLINKFKKPHLTPFNGTKTNWLQSEHFIIRYASQPESDTSIINPYPIFDPAGDVTRFCLYFTTIQSAPFLTSSLISFHQLLFQIPGRLNSTLSYFYQKQ